MVSASNRLGDNGGVGRVRGRKTLRPFSSLIYLALNRREWMPAYEVGPRMFPSTSRAVFACLVFGAVGVFGWLRSGNDGTESLPLLLYYAIVIVNTFFSIRTFSTITRTSAIQIF